MADMDMRGVLKRMEEEKMAALGEHPHVEEEPESYHLALKRRSMAKMLRAAMDKESLKGLRFVKEDDR